MSDLRERAAEVPRISPGNRAAALSELLHRFRNDLQVVVSLITLQADAAEDPEHIELLRAVQNRVRAISEVHAQLRIAQDLSTVHMGECLYSLARNVAADFNVGPRLQLRTSLADLAVDVDEAVPLALVTNELLSNAFGHGFPDGRAGEISLELRYATSPHDDQDWAELSVSDNGVGWPEQMDFRTANSAGMRICRGLVKQIGGSIHLKTDRGVRWQILFPLADKPLQP